jgi:hypothetical protein
MPEFVIERDIPGAGQMTLGVPANRVSAVRKLIDPKRYS